MTTPRITLAARAAGAPLEEAQASHWRPIADRWPTPEPPGVRLVELDALLADPAQAAGSAVLAVFHTDADASLATALADALYDKHIPALFLLADEVQRPLQHLQSETVFLARFADDPATHARSLHVLIRRQPALDAAMQELAMSRRFHNGLRAQMDRVTEELQLASFVQKDFLPKTLPCFGGLDFGVLYRPAGYVSGDIYDVHRLDEHHAGFFVADVIGHGVPAALLTMVIQKSLPTKEITGATYRIVPPAEALTRLNIELIRQQGESARFASAVYGVIDVRTGEVAIAGAGHPPPLVFSPEAVRRIETPGGLLGVFADEVYGQTAFTLAPDESLTLHTDGFETAFPDPGADAYGRRLPTTHYVAQFERLAADARAGISLEDATAALGHRLDQQPGSLHQADDLTALTLLRDPARAPGGSRAPVGVSATPSVG